MGIRNSTFRNSADLASALSIPVLAVVPVMETLQERRTRVRRRLIRMAGVIALLVCGAAVAWLALT